MENLTNLTFLTLYGNNLTGTLPQEIGNLTNLRHLSVGSNELTGSIPTEIGDLTELYRLGLGNNQFSGQVPESICDLDINFDNDYYFYIYNNQLCPPYPYCIEEYVGVQDTTNCD